MLSLIPWLSNADVMGFPGPQIRPKAFRVGGWPDVPAESASSLLDEYKISPLTF